MSHFFNHYNHLPKIFEDLRIKETRDEIGSWSRYSKSSAYKHRDGLWAKCMNI